MVHIIIISTQKEPMNDATRYELHHNIHSTLWTALQRESQRRHEEEHPFVEAAFPGLEQKAGLVRGFVTSLGQRLVPEMAAIIVEGTGRSVMLDYPVEGVLPSDQVNAIDDLVSSLAKNVRLPEWQSEIEDVIYGFGNRAIEPQVEISVRADLVIDERNGRRVFHEIRSPKMSPSQLRATKRDILLLKALRPEDSAVVGIYYDPGNPQEGNRSTWARRSKVARFFETRRSDSDILIGKDFWDALGGPGTYDELIEIFREIGQQLREECEGLSDTL